MSFQTIMQYVVVIGIAIGFIDSLLGDRMHVGEKFRSAYEMAGSMFLSMVGAMCLAPVIASILKAPVSVICGKIGIDPSILSIVLGTDMGGYPLAMSMAENHTIATMHGTITAAYFGGTITFGLPLSIAVVRGKDFNLFARGIIIGMIMIPFGSSLFGIFLGLTIAEILVNNLVILMLSLLFAVVFVLFPERTGTAVNTFGKAIGNISIVCISVGSIAHLLGKELPFGFTPVMDNMLVICGIIITLSGMLPIMLIFNRTFEKPLKRIGKLAGLDGVSVSGMLVTLVSCAPMLPMLHEMNDKGKIVNGMWLVLNAATFGSQMSYLMTTDPTVLFPFIVAKLITGVIGLFIARIYIRHLNME